MRNILFNTQGEDSPLVTEPRVVMLSKRQINRFTRECREKNAI